MDPTEPIDPETRATLATLATLETLRVLAMHRKVSVQEHVAELDGARKRAREEAEAHGANILGGKRA